MQIKKGAKTFWHFLWESDSLWSWVVLFIIAFALVRLVIFPTLGAALGGTPLPLVVVESKSMEHSNSLEDWIGAFGDWYFKRNITREDLAKFKFSDGIDKGDIIVTRKVKEYYVGDVIIFKVPIQSTPIIHRIVGYRPEDDTFETKGDNNYEQLMQEKVIKRDQIVSKAVLKIPKLGWIKLAVVETIRSLSK